MATASPARYVPPHLRGKSAVEPASTYAASAPSPTKEAIIVKLPPGPLGSSTCHLDAIVPPLRKPSPISSPAPGFLSANAAAGPSRPIARPPPPSSGKYEPPGRRSASPAPPPPSALPAAASAPAPRQPRTGGPSLYVFGDSFVGPMRLLHEDNVRPVTFKGASAKGLNNNNSIKQVSKELLPQLNALMAPPPYVYMPSSGRWTMLMFGNVDLQINYLWQLQHRRISHLSFPPNTPLPDTLSTPVSDLPRTNSSSILANATDTAPSGPALGPELFVSQVMESFITWLDREIVNGPVGQTLRRNAEDKRNGVSRRIAPGKILLAAALPPLVDDETLHRIPEKYVNRLEEEHEERARKLGQESASSWRSSPRPPLSALPIEGDLSTGLSTLAVSDRPPSPLSTTSSSRPPSIFEHPPSEDTSTLTSNPPSPDSAIETGATPINDLLQHDPPLCTLPVRVRMTNHFNSLLRDYTALHPDIFAVIDITPAMQRRDKDSGWTGGEHGQVDRGTWACPVDPTNIHPLWEITLPLWLDALRKEGVPVDGFSISQSAEETFKAYEADKRRRIAEGDFMPMRIREE